MKTFKIPNYANLEFIFNTNTYTNNINTYVGITCIENGLLEPYSNLTVNLCIKLENNQAFIDINNNERPLIKYLTDKSVFLRLLSNAVYPMDLSYNRTVE